MSFYPQPKRKGEGMKNGNSGKRRMRENESNRSLEKEKANTMMENIFEGKNVTTKMRL